MTHPIHTARRRGFTILEVMVALGILVTAMVVLVGSAAAGAATRMSPATPSAAKTFFFPMSDSPEVGGV